MYLCCCYCNVVIPNPIPDTILFRNYYENMSRVKWFKNHIKLFNKITKQFLYDSRKMILLLICKVNTRRDFKFLKVIL